MRIALDTNRYTDFGRGDQEVTQILESAERIYLPLIVIAELRAGFAYGSRGRQNEEALQRFLLQPGVGILYPSDATTRFYAEIYRGLRERGALIPINDLWIAALVLEHDLVLCTRDKHFKSLPGLRII